MGGPITHSLAALYALGALDESDRRPFEAHLARCDRCRADVDSFTAAVSALAFSVAPVQPPPSLRARILDAIDGCRQKVVDGSSERRGR